MARRGVTVNRDSGGQTVVEKRESCAKMEEWPRLMWIGTETSLASGPPAIL
jgi:hypothetical protein